MKKICILGGDKRQIELYNMLKCDYDIKLFGFDQRRESEHNVIEYIKKCDVLMLPIPLKMENSIISLSDKNLILKIDDIVGNIRKDSFVFYGGLSNQIESCFIGIPCSFNLLKDEDFLLKNASLTAKAALAKTMTDLNMDFEDLDICVIGYGRIGKEITRLLNSYNAKVTICSTRNIATKNNEEIVKTSNAIYAINKADIVFNTAPYTIVKNDDIDKVDKNVKIFELASRPYGFDIEFWKDTGYDIEVLPSLPGKVLFKSAAKIIYNKIITMLEKNNGINR